MINVSIIQRPLLLLIFPADSNVESSNIASLESGYRYLYLDTAETSNVPAASNARRKRAPPISELPCTCKGCCKNNALSQTLSLISVLKPRIASQPAMPQPSRLPLATLDTPPASAQQSRLTSTFR